MNRQRKAVLRENIPQPQTMMNLFLLSEQLIVEICMRAVI